MQKRRIKHSLCPLCFLRDDRLLCYQHGDLVVLRGVEECGRFRILSTFKERILGRSRLFSRFLRLGIRAAESIDDENVALSIGSFIYEFNITNGVLSKGFFCGNGVRPLVLTSVTNIKGFKGGLYFGGYLGNTEKAPVSIYHRIGIDKWEVIYSFPKGTINHVHNIVLDPYRDCLWVFTGDFDEAAAIWRVTDNFKIVERVACNNQKYRGCVVFALPEGLLYATDAPFEDNHIYLMNTETNEVKEMLPIHGSCIYGCQWNDKYVFSSTVEGDGRDMSRWEWLFTRKRGAGIRDDYVHMYIGNLNNGFKEVYKEKKDCMPFYTFQFGAFKFPYGENKTEILYFQPIATSKHDLDLIALTI